ncbi:MAG: hypothetical protein MRERC_2c111 [Mycoplasmataceae bacterium RC_NB112A]|nr:MAG: hypothetical protein MRERC_2c111 [Mycoplasmataceae bacterium RC_NB112A]
MLELIIIKTNQSQEIRKILEKKHIHYEIYQIYPQDWETKEKIALREWEKLSDEELVSEWENLPND